MSDSTERALWVAMRSLEERADLSQRMAERAKKRGHELAERLFMARVHEARHNGDVLRALLTGSKRPHVKERHDADAKTA